MRGEKYIELYSYEDAESLYTYGNVTQVAQNGIIKYENDSTRHASVSLLNDHALTKILEKSSFPENDVIIFFNSQ